MTLTDRLKMISAAGAIAGMLAVTPQEAYAQETTDVAWPQPSIDEIDPTYRLAVLGTNVALMGTICGITAAIEGRDVIRDAAHCALGATIQYTGMELGMHNVPILPGIGLRIVETGTSIIDNTLAGRDILDRLQYELGPLLFEIDTQGSDSGVSLYWRIGSTAGLAISIARQNRLSIGDTLSYQTFIFEGESVVDSASISNGQTIGNIILISEGEEWVIVHEFDHVLQYVRARPFQQALGSGQEFIENDLHLRIGEDVLLSVLALPELFCSMVSEGYCSRQWFNLHEAEAYIMQTVRPRPAPGEPPVSSP